MDDSPTDPQRGRHALVVVYPVVNANPRYRRVDILGRRVSKAHSLRDVAEFCRRAGLEDIDVEVDESVQWIGGGPRQWQE
jgi:hypothetical protein